jgi:catechol 2,3-dioxygenase-like lactoylglutathione lyase family enzyme
MLTGFSHVMMYVRDLDRAAAWYVEKLGFGVRFKVPQAYASLFHEGIQCRLDLHPTEGEGKDVGWGPIPNFAVDDLEGALAKLQAMGVKTSEPRQEGESPRFASFWDSEGNALGLEESR